ncbi:Bax inhibitor-1/YccA family protein [Actinomycetaceae bacterium MB13-C1-2]|nr:Bax inhibitor-1/YccA family protein [Actinomycetaceae bacterium MB13-C1-2]
MSNPVFSRLEGEWSQESATRGAGAATATTEALKQQSYPTYDQQAFQRAQESYAAPAADSVDTGRMTYDDVIVKTAMNLGVALLFAVVAWMVTAANPGLGMGIMTVGLIAGLVVAMVNIFSKTIRPALILLYSALEGLALGALSYVVDAYAPGVVLQALIATFAVFGVTLALFSSGKVRNSPKMQRFVLISLVGLIVSRLLIWILGMVGLPVEGVYNQSIFGIPLAVFISLFAVLVGAMSLIGDFDQVKIGVQMGAPAQYAWSCAFGIMVTVVWLYVELLNMLSRLNRN